MIHVGMTFEEYKLLTKPQRTQLNHLRAAAGLKRFNLNTGKPSVQRGIPRPHTRGPRPHMRGRSNLAARGPRPQVWITGPDPKRHERYQAFLRARAQANFRKETFDLDFDQWFDIWGDKWSNRGRGSDQYCMVLLDPDHGWCVNNVEVITRKEHLQRLGKARIGTMRRVR